MASKVSRNTSRKRKHKRGQLHPSEAWQSFYQRDICHFAQTIDV